MKFAEILRMLHEMERFVLDAFTCPKLNDALCMNCIARWPDPLQDFLSVTCASSNTNSSNRMQIDATKLPPNDCID